MSIPSNKSTVQAYYPGATAVKLPDGFWVIEVPGKGPLYSASQSAATAWREALYHRVPVDFILKKRGM